jgi:hypothetical protein
MPRFGSGICIHCAEPTDQLTADHILPESWYPDSTPPGLEKWQAPSCHRCNNEYGKFERNLFQRLALGVDPWIRGGEGIGDRALRSCDPRAAKNDNDRSHREAGREKLRRRVQAVPSVPLDMTILPNVGTIPSSDSGYSIETVPWSDIERLVSKFIRGISYLATQQVLPPGYVIRVVRPDVYSRMPEDLLNTPATIFERGPGFRVERHAANDDPFAALFRIFLWGKYEFFGAIWSAALEAPKGAGG